MKNTGKEKIRLNLIEVEEERVNTMMFALGMLVSGGGGIAVMGFLGGTAIDLSIILILVVFILFRVMEKYIPGFIKYAKYAYLTI